MKIELELGEIFEDEDGNVISKSLSDRIVSAVILQAQQNVTKLVKETFDREITHQIPEIVRKVLENQMEDLLDKEYTPINRWGDGSKSTTMRKEICETIEKQLVWKDGSFDSDRSIYTKAIKCIVEEKLKEFAKEYAKAIDDKFVAECMQHAVNKIRNVVK